MGLTCVFKQKLHTISTCITQTSTRKSHVVTRGCKLQMSHHMQSTYKAHRKHMVIAGESHVEKNYNNFVTYMQSTCNHMVITGGSHVDAKYEFLVTCGYMVITGGSHVEANYKFLVSRIAHVKHMKKHVTTR